MKNEFIKQAKKHFKNVTNTYFSDVQVKMHNEDKYPVATIEYNGQKVALYYWMDFFYGPLFQDDIDDIKAQCIEAGQNWED